MVTKGKDGYFNGPTFERPVVLTHKAKNYSDLRVLQDLTPTSHLANIAPEILSWVSNIQGMEFFLSRISFTKLSKKIKMFVFLLNIIT